MLKAASRAYRQHLQNQTVTTNTAHQAMTELSVNHELERIYNGYSRQIGRTGKRPDTIIIRCQGNAYSNHPDYLPIKVLLDHVFSDEHCSEDTLKTLSIDFHRYMIKEHQKSLKALGAEQQ